MKLTDELLQKILEKSLQNVEGFTANYIPELANVDKELTAIAVAQLHEGRIKTQCSYSNKAPVPITLQSTGKMIPLIGLLEEFGTEQLFEWVKVEPSGDDFASITRLEKFGPKPSNPMVNAGAIALCARIPGQGSQQLAWLKHWVEKLFNCPLNLNPVVFSSEKRSGDRNRSLAYLLRSLNNLPTEVGETLDLYFALCSYEAKYEQMLYLPTLLANGGQDPNNGKQIISKQTCQTTIAIMATCGLYNETGTHMVKTGMPAKSGVSGYTVAVIPGKAGIVVLSPRVNAKGNSIRGELMLESLSKAMNWHISLR